ncbi:MAG: PAS domain S-box protein [Anaerolineales bacterium]
MSTSNIMVVEDSEILLLDIQKSLKSFGYTVVTTASSKEEAIQKADETRPDLVLIDIHLGGETGGIDTANYIREHFNIPIVFLTGNTDEDTSQRAKIADPFEYIFKPFDPESLRATIEIALHNQDLKSQLHESERRYRTLVETMNDGVGQVDADGKVIFANNKLCQMTGYSQEELVGREHVNLFSEEYQELQQEEFDSRKTGKANTFETVLVRKDGSTLPVILSGSPVFGQEGSFVGSIGVITDISEQKRSEQVLRRKAEEMDALQDTILGLTSPNTSLQEFLQGIVARAADMLHASSGGLYVTEPEKERVRCVVSYNTARDFTGTVLNYGEGAAGYVAQTGKSLVVDDYRIWSGRASVYETDQPFQAVLSAPLIWQGSVTGVIHLLRDEKSQKFTKDDLRLLMAFADHAAVALENTRLYDSIEQELEERKQAEAEVRKSKQALEKAERLVHLGHYEIDPATGMASWSEEIYKIFGLDPNNSEPTVKTYKDLIYSEDRSKVYASYDQSVQQGLPFDLVYRIVRPNGDIRYVHSNARTLLDEDGNTTKLFGTFQDITELKQVELAFKQSEERYRTLFENSPISIWEEDFSDIQTFFMDLRKSGVTDFRTYFEKNPEVVSHLAGKIKITSFNKATKDLFKVESKDDIPLKLPYYFSDESMEVFREELIALAEGETKFKSEIPIRDPSGQRLTFQLDLAVAPAYEQSLEKVLISILDITERKQAEEIMLARYRLVRKSLSLTLPDLLQATLDETEALTKSSIGFFLLVEADQVNLSLQAWSTNTLQNLCKGEQFHYPIDKAGVWVDCIRDRKPVIHNDYEMLAHRKGLPEGHAEIRRELLVPILRGDNIVAVIGVGNKEAEYTRKDVEIVSLLADLAWDIVERKQTEAALRKSEALYHDLVETAQDLIWQCDYEGRYMYLNPAWEDVLGYKVDEMLGRPFTDFQIPETATRDQEMFAKLIDGTSMKGYETVHLSKDGRQVYLIFNAKSVQDEQGNVIGARGTAYDISDRKRAEDALLKSEYLLRESQKLARMGHYTLDIPSGDWESSDSLNELFGIDWNYQTDIGGWLQLVDPNDREDMAAYFREEVIEKRQEFDKEYRIIRVDDGKTRWVHGLGRLEFDEDGAPIRMIGNIQDITERKQAEAALRESEGRMRLLANAAHEGIVFSEEGRVIEANKQIARMLGCDLSELIGMSVMEFVAPESRSQVLEKIKSGAEEPYEHLAMKKDGIIFPVEVRAKMMNVQGRQMRVTAILDVSKRKQAGEMLAQERQRLSNVIEGTNAGTWEWNVQTGEAIFNERWAEIIGYSLEEISPVSIETWIKFAHPDDLKLSNELLEKHFNGELDYYECETRMRHKHGNWVWVLDRGKVATWTEAGKPLLISGTHQDITERKLAEESLRTKTAELEALFSLSAHLRTAQSADEMLPVVLTEIRRVLHSEANAVILLESDGEHFSCALSDGPLAVNNGVQFNVEKSISGLIFRTRQPYITEDFSSDPNKTTTLLGEDNLGPAVFAPVVSESEFLGVLLCARNKDDNSHPYTESDVQLLTAIGEMVGNALRRARLYDQALMRLQNVQTLHSIDMAISANLDLSVILDVLLSQGTAQLNVDAASILLLNPHTHMLEFAAGNGFRTRDIRSARLRLGEGLPGKAAIDRRILHITNLLDADNLLRRHLLDEGFVSYQAAPLVAKGQLQGVLEIFNRKPIMEADEQIAFLETLATQAAIAIDNSQLFSDLQRSNYELEMAYDATIEGWSRALELRDQDTEGHTLRVTDMTLRLAQAMGVRGGELIHIRRGALLHDIGKMGVPDRILLKTGKLDNEEWEIMKQHTVNAFEMLWPIEFLRPALDIPHCHHERWDGTGYPRQLKHEQIPLSARVFAIADVWDALTNDRPYRKAWTEEKAFDYITSNAGKHFDPQVIEKFIELRNGDG